MKGDNNDQKVGIDIIRRAIQTPVRQIAENAGVEGSIVVGKLLGATTYQPGATTPRPESMSTW